MGANRARRTRVGAVKVAVLGAGGTVGRAICRDLSESPEVERLLLVDRDAAACEAAVAGHAADKGQAITLDARGGLAEAIAGCAVLVNAASYRVGLEAMEAALEAGCHYVDLGGLYWMTARQLELDERFIAADLVGVLGIGGSPGMTNLMAAWAVDLLGDQVVTEIHVSTAGRDGDRLPYARRTLVDELTLPPIVLEDGAARALAPLAAGGRVSFPPPIGPADTIYALHSELQTFGRSFGVARASFRMSLAPELLTEQLEREPAAGGRPPSGEAIASHVVVARSAGRVARVTAVTPPHADWGFGGGVVSAAAPAAAAVRLIARGKLPTVGVVAPEACILHADLMPELELRGCSFTARVDDRPAAA
jgi:saccharopine dehydrogenase-like NADP-dependent oxidoreductase